MVSADVITSDRTITSPAIGNRLSAVPKRTGRSKQIRPAQSSRPARCRPRAGRCEQRSPDPARKSAGRNGDGTRGEFTSLIELNKNGQYYKFFEENIHATC